MDAPATTPEAVLRKAQARMLVRLSLEVLLRVSLGVLTLALLAAWAFRIMEGRLPPWPWAAAWTAAAILMVCAAAVAVRFPRRREVARVLDRHAGFQDRFVSYLEFRSSSAPSVWKRLSLRQNAEAISSFPFGRWTPLRPSASARWLIAPVLCLATLWIFDAIHRPAVIRDPDLDLLIHAKAVELEKLAEEIRKEAEARKLDELEKLAAEMKQAAERMKPAAGADSEEARKNALLEWSRLEARAAELSRKQPQGEAADWREVASALGDHPATAGISKLLKQDDAAAAAQAITGMLEKSAGDLETAAQLQELARKLGQAPMSSEQMKELAGQMRQAAAGGEPSREMQQAMQKLSRMLSEAAQSGRQSKLSSMSLGAMQLMKSGLSGFGPKPGPGDGKGGEDRGWGMGESPGMPEEKEGMGIGTGAGEKLFGDPTRIDGEKRAARVDGAYGEGVSFETILRGAGESSASTVEYRELFQQYTPEAEEAVFQEKIPLGSRYYIKRYFEGIQPE